MKRWGRGLARESGPKAVVGFHGDGFHDVFGHRVDGRLANIIVSTLHSAVTAIERRVPVDGMTYRMIDVERVYVRSRTG